jgi:STAM-binding protein
MNAMHLEKSLKNNTLLDDFAPLKEISRDPSPIVVKTPVSPQTTPAPQTTLPPPHTMPLSSEIKPAGVGALKDGLRQVIVPSGIVNEFLKIASENTKKNLETCGVLAGKLANNTFSITSLIVPKQTSTSDTVAMLNEEDIFSVQDEHELLTLGWIHTHPTQQCFMSSVDLHTHFPYQLLISEAIAIVVAPTQTPK